MVILAYAAWVMQQPLGKYSSIGHAKRVAPVFIAPIMAYAVFRVTDKLRSLFDRRADAQIKSLKQKLTKMLAELKDSTRYQRTQALIEKYDPEHEQKKMAMAVGAPRGKGNTMTPEQRMLGMKAGDVSGNAMNGRGKLTSSSSGRKLADRATSAAAGAVTGAGAVLSSALGQLVSSAANTLIADDPTVVGMLQQAQEQAKQLEAENAELRRLLGQRGSMANVVGGGSGMAGGGGSGPAEFAFGSPVSQHPDADALVESPRALSPPHSLTKKEESRGKNNATSNASLEKEEDGGDGSTPAAGENENSANVLRRSRRRSS
jgi:hypothetical protein